MARPFIGTGCGGDVVKVLVVHADGEAWDDLDESAVSAGLIARAVAIERLRAGGHLIACSPLPGESGG